MLPQFDRDVFDISPDKIAKVDNLHIPDLPMLHFPQNLTQNKKYSYHVTYHVTPKSFEQFLYSTILDVNKGALVCREYLYHRRTGAKKRGEKQ